jgi:hypothetical protein
MMRLLLLIVCAWMLTACTLIAADVVPTPEPSVVFVAPLNNQQVTAGEALTLDVVARSRGGVGVARVALYVDETLLGEGTPPEGTVEVFRVTMQWNTQGVGFHSLSAQAFDSNGQPIGEALIVVEVITP